MLPLDIYLYHLFIFLAPISSQSSRPVSSPDASSIISNVFEKCAPHVATCSHLFAMYALADLIFILDSLSAIKWFIACTVMYYITTWHGGVFPHMHSFWSFHHYTAHWTIRLLVMVFNSIANQGSIVNWAQDGQIHRNCNRDEAVYSTVSNEYGVLHGQSLHYPTVPSQTRHVYPNNDMTGGSTNNISQNKKYSKNRKQAVSHMNDTSSSSSESSSLARQLRIIYADPFCRFQHQHYAWFAPLMCFVIPTLCGGWFSGDYWRAWLYLAHLRWIVTLHMSADSINKPSFATQRHTRYFDPTMLHRESVSPPHLYFDQQHDPATHPMFTDELCRDRQGDDSDVNNYDNNDIDDDDDNDNDASKHLQDTHLGLDSTQTSPPSCHPPRFDLTPSLFNDLSLPSSSIPFNQPQHTHFDSVLHFFDWIPSPPAVLEYFGFLQPPAATPGTTQPMLVQTNTIPDAMLPPTTSSRTQSASPSHRNTAQLENFQNAETSPHHHQSRGAFPPMSFH